MFQISEHKNDADFYIKQSDLFDYPVFVPEVSDAISLILAELPCLLSITDMVEILLHVKHGPDIICWTVANFPDCFNEGNVAEVSTPFRSVSKIWAQNSDFCNFTDHILRTYINGQSAKPLISVCNIVTSCQT